MILSLITPIYRNPAAVRKYLEQMELQEDRNFEIILVVDTDSDRLLEVIDEFEKIKHKIKLIFNTKRQGRAKAIKSGFQIASGDYSIIISVSNTFGSNFVKDAIEVAKDKKTDIIEFESCFRHPKKFEGKIRMPFDKGVKIVDHPEIIAMAYPFDFNKMYKTELLGKVVCGTSILEVNSRFTLSIVYKALLLARTYSTVPKVLNISRTEINPNFNPLKLIRQWKELFEYVEEHHDGKYMPELTYARYFHEVVFLFAFVGASKNKVLLRKLKKNFDASLKTDFAEFFDANKYALRKNNETDVIIRNRISSKLTKLFKDL